LISGIIILSGVIIAASIALYEENEQVREFVDNSARKVNEVWIDITERLNLQQRERRQTERDIDRRRREAQSFAAGPWQTPPRSGTTDRPFPGMQRRPTREAGSSCDVDGSASRRERGDREPELEEGMEALGKERNGSSTGKNRVSDVSTLYDYDDEIPARAFHAAAILKEATDMRDGVRRRKGGFFNAQHHPDTAQSPSVARSTNIGSDIPPPSRSVEATARSGNRRALYEAASALPAAGIISGKQPPANLPSGLLIHFDQSHQLPTATSSAGADATMLEHESNLRFSPDINPPSTSREALSSPITPPIESELLPAFDLSEPHDPSATTPSIAQTTERTANQMRMPFTEEDMKKHRAVMNAFVKNIPSSSSASWDASLPDDKNLSTTATPVFSSNITTIPITTGISIDNEATIVEAMSTTANLNTTTTTIVNEDDEVRSISSGMSILNASSTENALNSADGDTLSDAETETASHVSVDGDMIMTPNGSEWDDDDASVASASSWNEVGSESDM